MSIKSEQQIWNAVFLDDDGNSLDTIAAAQAILNAVMVENNDGTGKGKLRVQVTGGVGQPGHKLGSWADDYEYSQNDIVNYSGNLYKCRVTNTGKQPDTETTYWEPYYGALGEKYVRATWFTQISAGSGGAGSIGLPPGDSAEFVFNEWPDGIDAVVCGLDADDRPDEQSVYTAGGVRVYVPASGGLSGDGSYSLSGTPATLPCAFVYRYRCKFRDFNSQYALKGCDFEEITDPAVLKTIQARDGDGVRIEDDGGNAGLQVLDGGGWAANITGILEGAGSSAVAALSGTAGDILYCGGGSTWTKLGKGSTGQVLTQGSGDAPEWDTAGGGSGSDYVQQVDLAFDYADTGGVAVIALSNGDQLVEVEIEITTIFNGGSPTLSVGIAGTTDKYMLTSDSAPKQAGGYMVEDVYAITSSETINLYVIPDGASQGAGVCRVKYVVA